MWRNTDVLDFVTWLRTHNDSLPAPSRIGFYGMDLYSLHSSSRAVVEYLARVDPRASNLARERYACFDRFGDDTQRYGYLAGLGITEGCQKECLGVVRQMGRERERVLREGEQGVEEAFDAEMNAKV